MSKIKVPEIGESITEGVISSWLKNDGDFVEIGDSIYELETDKITTEVPADESGVLKISVPAGETVEIGTEIGELKATDNRIEKASGKPEKKQPITENKVAPAVAQPTSAPPEPIKTESNVTKDDLSGVFLSPSMRRKAKRGQEIPIRQPAKKSSKTLIPATESITRKKMSPLRQRIAERLLASQKGTATLTTFNEIDMSHVIELRTLYKERFKEVYGVGLGFMGFFVQACVVGLKTVPTVNAQLDGEEIVYHNYYDIGIAVSTEKGLVVPVLRNCEDKDLAQIEAGIFDLASRARDNKLKLEEMRGGTFTISNGGVFGSLLATPIINPPQTGILGMHKIEKRPVVIENQVAIRPMMYVALSYDHRLIDGKESVTFLKTVKECIESPGRFLLDLE